MTVGIDNGMRYQIVHNHNPALCLPKLNMTMDFDYRAAEMICYDCIFQL